MFKEVGMNKPIEASSRKSKSFIRKFLKKIPFIKDFGYDKNNSLSCSQIRFWIMFDKNEKNTARHLAILASLELNKKFGFHSYRTGYLLELSFDFFLFHLVITYTGFLKYYMSGRGIGLYNNYEFLIWSLWCNSSDWVGGVKKSWRTGSIDMLSFLFGKRVVEDIGKRYVKNILRLPEQTHTVGISFINKIRYRKRIPKLLYRDEFTVADIQCFPKIINPLENYFPDDFKKSSDTLSFKASSEAEVYSELLGKTIAARKGDLSYYLRDDVKIDKYVYKGCGYPIEFEKCIFYKRKDKWVAHVSSSDIEQKEFNRLKNKKEEFTEEELTFIQKRLGLTNTASFIMDDQKDIQEYMKNWKPVVSSGVSCSPTGAG
jgi:hypothetical protein